MAEIGGEFKLNVSGVTSALKRVDSLMVEMQRRAIGLAASFGGMALAVAHIGRLAGRAVDAAAGMESLRAEFQTMLGSAKSAESLIAALVKFADVTPFTADDLAQNAKLLLSFGQSAESIMPSLRAIGDVAGSSRERFWALTLAFAQMSATGRLMGQDLLQMINAGFNPLQEISRTTGRSLAELKKAMEGGAISAEMVAGAFQSATAEGGRFFGNMESQSKTWNGLMSTLQGAMEGVFRAAGAPLMEAMKPAMDGLIDSAKKLAPMAGTVSSAFVWIATAAAKLGGVIAALAPLWIMLAANATGATGAVQRFTTAAGGAAWGTVAAGINRVAASVVVLRAELLRGAGAAAAMRAGLVMLGAGGAAAMATLAAAARAAGAAIVAAFGPVTLIILAVTWALQKAFGHFMALKAAADEQEAAIKDLSREYNEAVDAAKRLTSEAERQAFLAEKSARVTALRRSADDSQSAGKDELAEMYRQQAKALDNLIERVERMPAAAMRANEAMQGAVATTASAAEDAAKRVEASAKRLADAKFAALGAESQREAVLGELDVESAEELDGLIAGLQERMKGGGGEDWMAGQLAMALEARAKLLGIEKEIADAAEKRGKEEFDTLLKRAALMRSQDEDVRRARAEATGDEAAVRGIDRTVAVEKATREGIDAGLAEDVARKRAAAVVDAELAARDAAAARVKATDRERAESAAAAWREEMEREARRLEAVRIGDLSGAREVEREGRRAELAREGIERGGLSREDAERGAAWQEGLEDAARAAEEERRSLEEELGGGRSGGRRGGAPLYASSLARVGGGGGVAGTGDQVLREAQRHTQLLSGLRSDLRDLRKAVEDLEFGWA
jgi:tape measure domain-containing protein